MHRPIGLRRAIARVALQAMLVLALAGCGGGGGDAAPAPPPPAATRTWMLGLSAFPPRPQVADVLRTIDLASQRTELLIIHEELPWTHLLAGMSADAIVQRDKVDLVGYARVRGLKLVFVFDLDDGLDRAKEAPQLRAAGRSVTEPAVQQAYRSYVLAVARLLKPDYIGLAAETNLIRLAAPAPLYSAVVSAANAAARDLRAAGFTTPLFVSVQVEAAWGLLQHGPYVGIAQDLADFPFLQMVGLSSYPYVVYADPADIPADYYSRVVGPAALPAMVVEGGWTSATVAQYASSPDTQARYMARHAQLVDSIRAVALIQLVFADADLAAWGLALPPNFEIFTKLGLVNSDYSAKPAQAAWDALHARMLVPDPPR